jgi:predicted naringenin-chalcone synthase
MFLHALATATPPRSLAQADCLELARSSAHAGANLDRRSRLLLGAILRGDSGIETRQFALTQMDRLFDLDADELNEEFRRAAPALAASALQPALQRAGLRADELDALVVCTCTGYLCPGVSSYLAEIAGLRADAWLQDLVGLGCGAAIPALRATHAIINSNPDAVVACVAVEVCSAAFYLDNDPGVIISACLFGDGAAATVWRGTPAAKRLRCHGFDTHHDPLSRDRIRFEQRNGKLRNLLHPAVPALAAAVVRQLHDRATKDGPIGRVVSHAGGKDVIAALQAELPDYDLGPTRAILRRHGNMSSPSVLFALEELMKEQSSPRAGADWWLASFGAGFSAHACRISAD